jgi:hypothetical protein
VHTKTRVKCKILRGILATHILAWTASQCSEKRPSSLEKPVSGWHREPNTLISNISSRHPEHRVAAYAKLRTDSRSHSALAVGRFLLSYVLHNTRARFFSFPCIARASHSDFVLCILWLSSHSARSVGGATSAVCSSTVARESRLTERLLFRM